MDPLLGLIAFLALAQLVLTLLFRSRGEEVRRELVLWRTEQENTLRANHRELAELQRREAELIRGEWRRYREEADRIHQMLVETLRSMAGQQRERLVTLASRLEETGSATETRLEAIRSTVEEKLGELRRENGERLEAMRQTVEEKLHGTLEKRLGESFRQVSERLEQVHRGLGEMQTLAIGVGDLKKVLTNVKTRGTWGEVQLGALLEEMLAPGQFERNVRTRPESSEVVEYAIRLPGREAPVWLPVDAKFPVEDYHRLLEAQERGDTVAAEEALRALGNRLQQSAKEIATKYLNPPCTTDFALLFVPSEGLFAEACRKPGMLEELQRRYRVVVAGPTTLAALLNSLQMGFRTLTIQRQSSQVWQILGEVRHEFSRFGESLEGVKKKLAEASNRMDDVGRRSRAVERRLRHVEGELPGS